MLTSVSCIYAGRCLASGKRYIGSALNGRRRRHEHVTFLNAGTHHNRHLQNAWDKYGRDQFVWELIEECPEESMLLDREQFWVDFYDSTNPKLGYNIAYPVKQRAASKRMSAAHKAYWGSLTDGERAERVAHLSTEDLQALATAGKQKEAARARASKQVKEQWTDPDFRELIVSQLRKRLEAQWADPIRRAEIGGKISARAVARWEEPVYRERGLKQIKAASDKARAILDDPVKMQERLDLLASVRDKAAEATRAKWRDPEFRARRTAQMVEIQRARRLANKPK